VREDGTGYLVTTSNHFQPAYLSSFCFKCVYRRRLLHDRCPDTEAAWLEFSVALDPSQQEYRFWQSGFGPAALGIHSILQNIVEVGEAAFDEVVKPRRDAACRSGHN
jgi:hypothetical protein